MHQILSVDKEPLIQLAFSLQLDENFPSFNTRFNFLHPDRKTISSVSLRGSIMKTHSKTQKVLALNSVLIWKNKYILSFCLFVCLFVWIDESAEETQLLKEISSWDKENCLCKANCATYLGDVVSGHPVVQFFMRAEKVPSSLELQLCQYKWGVSVLWPLDHLN